MQTAAHVSPYIFTREMMREYGTTKIPVEEIFAAIEEESPSSAMKKQL